MITCKTILFPNITTILVRLVSVMYAPILCPYIDQSLNIPYVNSCVQRFWSGLRGGGGGGCHMKQTGMLVVSLRGVNFWILVSLRVFRAKRQYFMPARSRLGFREETQNSAKKNRSQIFFLRTYALIVSAHRYCARTFTCHVIHERAR